MHPRIDFFSIQPAIKRYLLLSSKGDTDISIKASIDMYRRHMYHDAAHLWLCGAAAKKSLAGDQSGNGAGGGAALRSGPGSA